MWYVAKSRLKSRSFVLRLHLREWRSVLCEMFKITKSCTCLCITGVDLALLTSFEFSSIANFSLLLGSKLLFNPAGSCFTMLNIVFWENNYF